MATFDSHPKSAYWSSRNSIKPCDVKLNSHKKFWFKCHKCEHEFERQLNEINRHIWCPYCSNKNICNYLYKCQTCIEKSFASVEYSKYWSKINKEKPEEIFKNSHKKYWFDCPRCLHTYEQRLSHITRGNTCKLHNRILCNFSKNCITCYEKSFASNDKSKYWSNKNVKQPIEIFKSSSNICIFDCDKCGNEFKSRISHITDGSWCPICKNKTEDKFYKIMLKNYPTLKHQYKVYWCKNKKYLPFDFVIEENKIIIEIDGIQHVKQVSNWKSPEHNKFWDLYKMKCANENGFSIIRILQDDIYRNKYDWVQEISKNIEKLTKDTKVQNIYMCKKDEYKDFEKVI
jgi:very-short-patch-repair endonuclease/DNA-directed RNA polymerase subunit RPC12/RpoP